MDTMTNRKAFEQVTELLFDYLQENDEKSTPVVEYKSGHDLLNTLKLEVSEKGEGIEGVLGHISEYLRYSVRTSHPNFNNQLNGGFHFEAMLAELVSFFGNATMATFEVAPVATLLENKLVDMINKNIGFHNGDGIMLTGGSNANLMAIHVARNTRFPQIKFEGNGAHQLCVYVSKEAHYSHKKAMMLLGLGLDNLVLVDTDEQGRMCAEDLERKIQQTQADGKIPLMVCSTAGTTVLGVFDPIEKVNALCKTYKLWHHVDGAWGGAAMFSKKLSRLLKGLNEADSFTFDAHKLLGAGLITSFFCTKKKGVIESANCGGGSHYLFHEYENSEFDTGRKSLQCGRKVDSLKLWLMWVNKGDEGLEAFVDEQFAKQEYLTKLINEHPRLRLIRNPEYLNVCFQVLPKDESIDVNQYNLDVRFKLVKEGKFLTNYSSFEDGTIFFRHVFANNTTQTKHLDDLIEAIVQLAQS